MYVSGDRDTSTQTFIWVFGNIITMKHGKGSKISSGVFIDGSNLFWAQQSNWHLDYALLKDYLDDLHSSSFYNYYGCFNKNPKNEEDKKKARGEDRFYRKLEGYGFKLVTKPLKYLKNSTKGDMDVEIAVDVENYLKDLDRVIIVSGDSDFLYLIQDCHKKGKEIAIYSFEDFLAWEIKTFAVTHNRCNYKLFDDLEGKIRFIRS